MKKLTEDQIKQELKKIFRSIAPEIEFDKIDLLKTLREQIEIDSLDFYKILVEIKRNTGVNIPDSELIEMQNMKDLIEYIEKKS